MRRTFRLLLLLLGALTARAHPILQNPVWVAASPDRIILDLHVSVRELIVVQGLPVTDDGRVDQMEAEDTAPKHSDYVLDHFQIKADDRLLDGKVVNIKPPKVIGEGLEGPDRAHFVYTIEYPLATPPRTITISQNMCVEFPSSPGVPWDLSYAYRYGPHGATPLKFGALTRERGITFNTGFVVAGDDGGKPAAGSLVHIPRPATLLGLWIVFLAATLLGSSGSPGARYPYIAAVVTFAAGLAAGRYATAVPDWSIYLFCGACSILTAADNIHRQSVAAMVRRRVLLYGGCLFFGAAFGAQERLHPELARWWHLLPLPGAIVAVLIGGGIVLLARRQSERMGRFVLQISSLLCVLDAGWLMLKLLEAV